VRRLLVLIYALLFVDEITLLAIIPLTPFYRRAYDLSQFEAGVLLGAASLAIVAASVPVGLLGDRLGTRRVTLAGGVLLVASAFGQGLAPDFWALVAARFAFGLSSAVLWSAGLSWLGDSAGEDRPGAVGAAVTVAGIASVVGPAYAGVVADRVDRSAPFLVLGVISAVVVLALFGAGEGRQLPHEGRTLTGVAAALSAQPLVVGGVTLMLLGGFTDGVTNLIAPRQLADAGSSSTEIGIVLSVAAVLFVVASAGTARRGAVAVSLSVAIAATFLLAASLLPVVGSEAALAVIAMLILHTPPLGMLYTVTFPLAARGARSAGIGTSSVNGLLGVAWGASSFAGPLAAGIAAEATSDRLVYAVVVACCAAAAAWLLALRDRDVVGLSEP
jgi:predicted MFS family arabinose efflux permease